MKQRRKNTLHQCALKICCLMGQFCNQPKLLSNVKDCGLTSVHADKHGNYYVEIRRVSFLFGFPHCSGLAAIFIGKQILYLFTHG